MSRSGRGLGIAAAALALAGCGFTGNMRMDPGFASFRTPSTLHETKREVAVSLGPVPMRLATLISRPIFKDDEPWITDTLRTVRAVRVYIYEVDGDSSHVKRHIEATRDGLLEDGWQSIAAVREDGGLVTALVRRREPETVRGVAVMYYDDEELVLVNVMGKITPESLQTVMNGLEIDMPLMVLGDFEAVPLSAAARTE